MAIMTEDNRTAELTTDGVETEFDFSLLIHADSEVQVWYEETGGEYTLLTLDTDYTVSFTEDGGTVTTIGGSSPRAAGKILIIRNIELTQETNWLYNDNHTGQQHQDDFDRSVMRDLQIQEQLDRALLLETSSDTTGLTIPEPDSEKFLRWKSDLSGLENISAIDAGLDAISDVAYNATTWNANLDAASKNAIRDKIESMDYAFVSANDATTDITAAQLEQLSDGSETALHIHDLRYVVQSVDIDHLKLTGSQLSFSDEEKVVSHARQDSFLEQIDFTISEAGGTVTGSLEKEGGGDLIQFWSDDFDVLDCTPAKTVDLTGSVGTDTSPVASFVYILFTDKTTLVVNTSWPADSVEHIRVASIVLQSAATTGTSGALMNRNWNDFAFGITNPKGGAITSDERMRKNHAQWDSGVALTITGSGTGTVTLDTTAGFVYQLNRQAFPAIDMAGADDIHLINLSGSEYSTSVNLVADITTLADAVTSIGNNKFFNLVIWGAQNRTGENSHLMCNLPIGQYGKQSDAIIDAMKFSVSTIPDDFRGIGFLIAELTFKLTGGGSTWTLIQERSLLGLPPSLIPGGGTTNNISTFVDTAFEIFGNLDDTKRIAFQAASIATGTTRTITMADANVDLADIATNTTHRGLTNNPHTVTAAQLSLIIGTDTQAWDADLDTLATMQSGAPAALQLLTAAELAFLDGATAGTAVASKAAVLDASKDITGMGNIEIGTADGTFPWGGALSGQWLHIADTAGRINLEGSILTVFLQSDTGAPTDEKHIGLINLNGSYIFRTFNDDGSDKDNAIVIDMTQGDVTFINDVFVGNTVGVTGDVDVDGKVNSTGGVDPPYVLIDLQTKEQIVMRCRQEIPLSKAGGKAIVNIIGDERIKWFIPLTGEFIGEKVDDNGWVVPTVVNTWDDGQVCYNQDSTIRYYYDRITDTIKNTSKTIYSNSFPKDKKLNRDTGEIFDK